MKLDGNTILVTGGSSGIGLELAKRFVDLGNKVIICGRSSEKLAAAKRMHPDFDTVVCDVSKPEQRLKLFSDITASYPDLNVLVNNAGIQRYPILTLSEPWDNNQTEIDTNLSAPIHLSMLFVQHMEHRQNPAILNTTSGLSHVPLANAPIYSATKAALHSFTKSLRYQLLKSGIEVIEISPPKVDTDLGGPGLHTDGVNVSEFGAAVIEGLKRGESEITFGFSTRSAQASRAEREQIFKRLNP